MHNGGEIVSVRYVLSQRETTLVLTTEEDTLVLDYDDVEVLADALPELLATMTAARAKREEVTK